MNALLDTPFILHTLLFTPFDMYKFTILGNEIFKLLAFKNSFITLNLSVYGVLGGCTSFDRYVWNCAGLCIGQNILDIYALRKQYIKSGTGGVRGESSGASGEWKKIKLNCFSAQFLVILQ